MEVILEVIKEKMAETAEDYDKFGKRTGTTHKFGKKEEHYDD